MHTLDWQDYWPNHPKLQLAAHHVANGGVIAYPTEAVWGLGCDIHNALAVGRILQLKRRSVDKGLIVIAASMEQVLPYLQGLTPAQMDQLSDSWPAPLTWLVPKNRHVPDWISGRFESVAIRVSAHPVVQALCKLYGGPIVSTSANPQSLPAATTALDVHRYFGRQLDAVAPGVVGKRRQPSQIRDLLTDKVLR